MVGELVSFANNEWNTNILDQMYQWWWLKGPAVAEKALCLCNLISLWEGKHAE